ncbi:hypothetical protein [Mycobacterium sp. 141]|uniref:hypothetical protein n=1 Tax=Mycobacterium sp. 141 TaxID=1120797 RepID=UPI000374AA00|nr:hypothetical protein [Mycobacterium sp. 141]
MGAWDDDAVLADKTAEAFTRSGCAIDHRGACFQCRWAADAAACSRTKSLMAPGVAHGAQSNLANDVPHKL